MSRAVLRSLRGAGHSHACRAERTSSTNWQNADNGKHRITPERMGENAAINPLLSGGASEREPEERAERSAQQNEPRADHTTTEAQGGRAM